jgi:hypothetical protein
MQQELGKQEETFSTDNISSKKQLRKARDTRKGSGKINFG